VKRKKADQSIGNGWPWLLGLTLVLCLIVGGLSGLQGCSTSPPSSSFHSQNVEDSSAALSLNRQRAQLLRENRFTDAAMLEGLYAHSLQPPQYRKPTSAPVPLSPNKSSKPELQSVQPVSTTTSLPLPTPTAHVQKTSLNGKWHSRLGWDLMIQGNYAGAAAAYREALRQNQLIPDVYVGLGMLYRREGNRREATNAYQKALSLQPNYPAALVHLGYMYTDGPEDHRDYTKARHLFHQASKQGDPFAGIALLDLKTRK